LATISFGEATFLVKDCLEVKERVKKEMIYEKSGI